MKKGIVLLLLLALMCPLCLADGLPTREPTVPPHVDFPDPAEFLGQTPELFAHNYEYKYDAFDAYFLQLPEDMEAFLDAWESALQDSGYVVYRDEEFDGYEHVTVFASKAGTGMLYADYGGEMLLMVPAEYNYVPWTETNIAVPTAQPSPTVRPQPTSTAASGGDWVYVTIDCPYCHGGVCPLCNGTGRYTLYGESVDCPTKCTACGGEGTLQQLQWVPSP